MATIKASLQLTDGMTPVLRSMQKAMNVVLDSLGRMQRMSSNSIDSSKIAMAKEEIQKSATALDNVKQGFKSTNSESSKLPGYINKASNSTDNLYQKIKGVMSAIVASAAVKKVIEQIGRAHV